METFECKYSLKNIPTCKRQAYMTRLFNETNKFIEKIRWKAFWYERNNNDSNEDDKQMSNDYNCIYKFPTSRSAPVSDKLKPFENDLFNLISNIQWKTINNNFQNKLSSDIKTINKSKNVFVFSDKTNNIYEVKPDEYKKLLNDNIISSYKKSAPRTVDKINNEAQSIISQNKITGRIPKLSQQPAFITFKDHKPNFQNNLQCRLLNPAKSHMGKISKSILDNINHTIRSKTNLIQWKNSYEVINWFKNIRMKAGKCFLKFDIVNFYQSIKDEQLYNALSFARNYIKISDDDEYIIRHSCKTLLFDNDNQTWEKTNNINLFDIPMGSFMGAEICDLIGLYILDQLTNVFPRGQYGIYRDDALSIVNTKSPSALERLSKTLHRVFKNIGFKITIEICHTYTDFLDVTLNLGNNTYYPYKKPNSKTYYINKSSNHPHYIKNKLPSMIHKRLCNLSTNKTVFDRSKDVYNEALKASGYGSLDKYENYNNDNDTNNRKSKNRKRKAIYFNPPFCESVKTNLGRNFLNLINKNFPRHHPYRKIFNRNNVKLSYSCMPNMKSIIQSHNRAILYKQPMITNEPCNCRVRSNCPLNNKCNIKNVIYKASVESGGTTKDYIGSTGGNFKLRYANHVASFKHPMKRNATELSKYVWSLQDAKKNFSITWSILHSPRMNSNNINRICSICNLERLAIATADKNRTLNKRSQLTGGCVHYRNFYFHP